MVLNKNSIIFVAKHPIRFFKRPLRDLKVLSKIIYYNLSKVPAKITKNNKEFYVDYNVFWESVKEGRLEEHIFDIFDKYLKEDSIYIDIGSWIGYTTLYASNYCKVYAIEPDPISYKQLLKNINYNPLLKKNIKVFNECINDKNGFVKFGRKEDSGMSTNSIEEHNGLTNIKSIKFSDFVKENSLNKISFIKIDIEGTEPEVLSDMKEFFEHNNIILYLSLHPNYFKKDLNESIDKIISSIESFNEFFYEGNKRISKNDIIKLLKSGKHFEVLCKNEEFKCGDEIIKVK